jgi:hypothetical protein
MTMLELDSRIPDDSITEQAWNSGIAAFRAAGDTPDENS